MSNIEWAASPFCPELIGRFQIGYCAAVAAADQPVTRQRSAVGGLAMITDDAVSFQLPISVFFSAF